MATHNDFGKEAEKKAIKHLLYLGYKIREINWRYRKAEIDIIAEIDSRLIIVEVKARSSDSIIKPEEAVTISKKKLLLIAADYYIQQEGLDIEVRFDIISILKRNNIWEIKHIEDAFNSLL